MRAHVLEASFDVKANPQIKQRAEIEMRPWVEGEDAYLHFGSAA